MTKWRLKRLPDVSGNANFNWEQCDYQKSAHWDFYTIKKEIEKMEVGEEKIIEIYGNENNSV